jgi:hypothetical protein
MEDKLELILSACVDKDSAGCAFLSHVWLREDTVDRNFKGVLQQIRDDPT